MNNLSLKECEVVIDFWHLTIPHEEAAKQLLKLYRGLQKECEGLLEEIDRLQPPEDTQHIILVADHVREISARDREIERLISELRSAL